MDADRFDAIIRTFGSTTRRRALHLLAGGTLGSVLALLGRGDAAAACRQVGKPCGSGHRCCSGARCKGDKCTCKSTHFKCGASCCLDGAGCIPLFDALVCVKGPKQSGDLCDPTLPGQCTTGKCGCQQSDPLAGCFCREADCAAAQGICADTKGCCWGGCVPASAACGGGNRCCVNIDEACREDCDCCGASGTLHCRGGRCCKTEFGQCVSSKQCCGDLVCSGNQCVKQ